jgi:glycosyltransferase involved in cell wall biosynthesis
VIAISKFVKDYLVSAGEISDPRKISVVYYGFSAESFTSTTNLESKYSDANQGTTVFGTISRLSVEKDLITLIRGFSIFKQKNPNFNVELQVYGQGHLKENLEEQVELLGLEDSIRFMGRTNQPQQALQAMDVFVLTSKFEGFGMVLLEAMAVGVPTICSRIPTALEVLGDDGAAVYFEVGSAQDLSAKMQDLSSKNLDLLALETKYKKRLELFRPERNYDEIYSIYLDVIGAGIAS